MRAVAGQVHEHRSVSPTPLPGPPPTHTLGVKHLLGGQTSLPQLHCSAPPQLIMVRHEGRTSSPYVHERPKAAQVDCGIGAVLGHPPWVFAGQLHGQLPA
jgi:hypothetical protein